MIGSHFIVIIIKSFAPSLKLKMKTFVHERREYTYTVVARTLSACLPSILRALAFGIAVRSCCPCDLNNKFFNLEGGGKVNYFKNCVPATNNQLFIFTENFPGLETGQR
jgi:hypothetical protein